MLFPGVTQAQLSSRANRNLETFFVAGSTGLGKAEDGAHTSGDTGVMVLCVRNDTHTNALSGTDGDYTPCATDSTGKLGVRGTFAEDAGHASGDLGVHVLTVRQDTAAALAGTDADYQPLITDATGRLHANTELPDAILLANGMANPTAPAVAAHLLAWNGSTWDRAGRATFATDGVGGSAAIDTSAAQAVFNGIDWDRARSADLTTFIVSTTLTARNSIGAQLTEKGSRWTAISNPAAGSQATASIAAEVDVRHVADCVSFSAAATTAPALTALTINLRDGATGAGTVIWTKQVAITVGVGQEVAPFQACGLNLVGTTNTAMTLEWSASLANLIQEVSLSGFNVN